ncbi:ankyrin [Neocallimastix californiae]|uniref:Ankyrin n=1 Tax=Neocallimastix californiae TaxID=1754190 RepID=A0A1Y2BSZ2_9FUNG|nr:ankyrin [Neocallimastix californiae]|eukprot:ORY37861.1 ankyrin [Neocallimastix californiae]
MLKFDKISFNKEIRKVLDLLIKYGLDINRKDNDDNTPLIYAINVKNEEIVSYFLNHQANIQAVNEKIIIIDSLIVNKNVRNYYYSHSDTDKEIKNNILKMLINHGLNVNSVDKEGKLPIVYAIEKNNKELLEEHGLDLERSDNDHKYPLIYALEAENDFAFQYLLEKELDFKSFISTLYNRLSELSLLLNDYNNIFDLLIKNGFDVNRKDQHGKTLLNYEIEKKETDSSIIFYLLEFRRNFNLKMTQNKESFFEYLRSFNLLLEYGLDINDEDEERKILLLYAIEDENEFIVNYLLENHASIHSVNENIKCLRKLTKKKKKMKKELLGTFEFRMKKKKHFIVYAIEDENELIVNYLLENHASIHSVNENIKCLKEFTINKKGNEKELIESFEFRVKNKFNIIKLLLKYGLDINAKDEEGKTLLLYAINEVNEFLFYYLIKNKASLKSLQAYNIKVLVKFIVRINENENVLNKLIKYTNKEKEEEKCIKILNLKIQNGFDINDKDEEGNTILIYAIEVRKISVIQYLLERNASLKSVNSKIEILKPLITNIIPKSGSDEEQICNIDDLNFNILKLLIDYGLNMENNKKIYITLFKIMKNSNPEIDQIIENLLNNKKFIFKISCNIKLIRSLFNSIQRESILLKLLIQNGLGYIAKINDNIKLIKPLFNSIQGGESMVLKLLIQNGLNVNSVDEDNHSLLCYAIELDYLKIVPYLLKYDKIKFNILKILIENGLNIKFDDDNDDGKKIIRYIFENNSHNILKYLLKHGLDIQYINENTNLLQPLIYVSNKNVINILDVLLENGLKINNRDKSGKTLLDYCNDNNKKEIIKVIKEYEMNNVNNIPLGIYFENMERNNRNKFKSFKDTTCEDYYYYYCNDEKEVNYDYEYYDYEYYNYGYDDYGYDDYEYNNYYEGIYYEDYEDNYYNDYDNYYSVTYKK